MGEITLKVEEDILDRLRAQAVSNGRSVEDEVLRMIVERVGVHAAEDRERHVLHERILLALAEDEAKRPKMTPTEAVRRAGEIASMSPPITGVDLTQLIREDRDR